MDHSTGKEYYKHISSLLKIKKNFDEITLYKDSDLLRTCNTIVSHVSVTHAFVAPCQKIIKYLKHMQNASYEENNKIDDCRYLNLYINDNVDSTHGNPLTGDTYNTFIEAFISNYSKLDICKDNMKYIDKKVIVNIKKILDMYEKLNKVIDHSNPTSDDTCNNIDKCLDMYMSFQNKCKDGSENELCDALESFCNYYLLKSYRVKRCKDDISFPSFKVAQEDTSDQDDSPNPPDPELAHGQDDPGSSLEIKESLDEDVSGLKSSNSKTATAISTTLLLFPTLFTLYKFTPLGSLIRPYIQRNEKVQYNANDEMLQLYLPNYKPQDILDKEQINVPYQS